MKSVNRLDNMDASNHFPPTRLHVTGAVQSPLMFLFLMNEPCCVGVVCFFQMSDRCCFSGVEFFSWISDQFQ